MVVANMVMRNCEIGGVDGADAGDSDSDGSSGDGDRGGKGGKDGMVAEVAMMEGGGGEIGDDDGCSEPRAYEHLACTLSERHSIETAT